MSHPPSDVLIAHPRDAIDTSPFPSTTTKAFESVIEAPGPRYPPPDTNTTSSLLMSLDHFADRGSFVLADDIQRNDEPTMRPPSPPYVHIPAMPVHSVPGPAFALVPEPSGPGHLTPHDVALITGSRKQGATEGRNYDQWRYENRRLAQNILDYLYLGPLAVARDTVWLQKERITMIYAVRDRVMIGRRLVGVERAAADLGVEVAYLDLNNHQELIHSFSSVIELINAHMLRTRGAGKVLLVCETGNEHAAVLAVAYVMAMYSTDMVGAVQFVATQRFCSVLNEESKQLLLSYEHMLAAERMTADARLQEGLAQMPAAATIRRKRGIEDTMDGDEDGDISMDGNRFSDRPAFAPFVAKWTG